MTIAELIATLRAAGATRVRLELDFEPVLRSEPSDGTFPPQDQAHRGYAAPTQLAESPSAQSPDADEAEDEQQARDLELAHT